MPPTPLKYCWFVVSKYVDDLFWDIGSVLMRLAAGCWLLAGAWLLVVLVGWCSWWLEAGSWLLVVLVAGWFTLERQLREQSNALPKGLEPWGATPCLEMRCIVSA